MNKRIKLLSFLNRLIPKKRNQLSIYGRRMLNDNSAALVDYLIAQGYNDKYRLNILVTKNVDVTKYRKLHNVRIISNPLATFWVLFRSWRIFHSQGMTRCSFIPSNSQKIFDLWHGSPLKCIGVMAGESWYPATDSYFLCASPFMAEINKRCFLLSDDQIFIGANPRNDLLFHKSNNDFLKSLRKDKKLVLYMPTFRNSRELAKHDSSKDFPIISLENIDNIDKALAEMDVVLIIKPHPYQNEIPLFNNKHESIKILKNDELNRIDLPLYELLGQADALISDFSSVYFDYLLLNRPIGFVIEDISEYAQQRGYTVEDPLALMPGKKIKNETEFIEFIKDVVNEKDDYINERMKINTLCNTYTSPDASHRILEFLEIKK